MHYYLWWSRAGSPVTAGSELPTGSILVKAIRHHHDHAPLEAGNCHPLTIQDITSEELTDSPWTMKQIDFARSDKPVRILIGNPGSGKTTALWKAVAERDLQKVLYLTWSKKLAEATNDYLSTFAPEKSEIVTQDFRGFVSEILGRDLPRMDMAEIQRSFKRLLGTLDRKELGDWKNHPLALLAEIRAVLLGQLEAKQVLEGHSRLSDFEYIKQRSSSLGKDSAERVIRIFTLLNNHPEFLGLFQDIHATMEALQKVGTWEIPAGWNAIDRIVIDEIQDLTAIEASLIFSFHSKLSISLDRMVWILLAGDEGQTVLPTDFSWGALKKQIHDSLEDLLPGVPLIEEFKLESNLRCPQMITEVVNRSATLYRNLTRVTRPANQTPCAEGPLLQAQLLRLSCTKEEASKALESLAEEGRIIFLRLDSSWPKWIPKKLRDFILTPEEAKGLEYQAVCILDPGRKLQEIEKSAATEQHGLDELAARTMIDRLRVALSRATETLVFLDVEADQDQKAMSAELLGHAAETEVDQLIEDLRKSELSQEDRVASRLRFSIEIEERDIQRAWRLAHDALQLLGDPNLPNGVVDEELRWNVQKRILALGAQMLLNQQSDEVAEAVASAVEQAFGNPIDAGLQHLFDGLKVWACCKGDHDQERCATALKVLIAIESLGEGGGWIRSVAAGFAQSLRKAINAAAKSPVTAAEFTGNLGEWLAITGEIGDIISDVSRLRATAFDTLLSANRLQDARKIYDMLPPGDSYRLARLLEGEKDYAAAAAAYELVNYPTDALRNWRAAGKWEEAVRLAVEPEKSDLQWLADLQCHLGAQPKAVTERLTKAENTRFRALWESFGKKLK